MLEGGDAVSGWELGKGVVDYQVLQCEICVKRVLRVDQRGLAARIVVAGGKVNQMYYFQHKFYTCKSKSCS